MQSYLNYQFVFVNGLHRSGTSLLYRLLSSQKDFSGFLNTGVPEDEGQHLQTIYKAAKHYGGPGRFGFDKGVFLNEHSNLITDQNRIRLFKDWSVHWDLSKKYLVEKSPPNIVRTRFLQAMYSNSYFITILRDPIAVSFATQKWSKNSLDSLLKHWLICNDTYLSDAKKLRNSILFKYEDFTNNPKKIINDISDFLGVELSIPENLVIKKGVNDKYYKLWKNYQKSFWTKRKSKKIFNKYELEVNKYDYTLSL